MLKNKIIKELKSFWNDEDAQGMMEYILLAVIVIGAISVAKDPIMNAIRDKSDSLGADISSFEAQ